MPAPIPIHGHRGPDLHAGTGFIVRSGDQLWLVTCVHLITGLKENPARAEVFVGGFIQVVGSTLRIPLFEGVEQRFNVVINKIDGLLLDAMAIRLTATEWDALCSFGAYEHSSIVAPHIGEPVSSMGFPGMQLSVITPLKLTGTISEIVGVSVKLTCPSAPGHSGGALIGNSGLIGIIHADTANAAPFEHALALSFDVLGPALFV